MDLKLNKKQLKSLSGTPRILDYYNTREIGGGCSYHCSRNLNCDTDAATLECPSKALACVPEPNTLHCDCPTNMC
ncbi:hypothetical protein EAG18_18190 [Pseudoalteromonas sp. J010]|uniref:hypothetical protein n=1 Tax=Pseudoalteromonas sp. J010 TaxID=998465 RepID=UPI000F6551CF|nr:hypothetical protein [Pseudoalteromonas sp. J010]RRS07187.1 hypothetical protein EAG18_18190 [Pseudoalteromonas sp. J010]